MKSRPSGSIYLARSAHSVQTATGRLQDQRLASTDRNFAMWMHVSVLLALFVVGPFAGVAPLILWLSRRDRSPFNDDHGREVVNMSITGVIVLGVGMITLATGIGMLVVPIWLIIILIGLIRGAVAASNGEYFRYPMTIRFLT